MLNRAVWAAALLTPGLSPSQDLKPEEIYARLLPSVMTLKVVNTQGDRFTGSGFLALGEGLAVTSWHVVFDAAEVTAHFADGTKVEVLGVVDKDERHDLALIRLKITGRPLAKLAKTPPRVGARAYVIGAPRGFAFSIADGLLSQVQSIDGFPQYQMSCPLSTGNSGGPMVNERGEVVGVASWSKIDAQNVNFAVPAEHLSRLNPRKPVVPCKDLAARAHLPVARSESTLCAKTADETDSDRDLESFRKFLKTSAGQKITVTVQDGKKPQVFNFVVPE
ncbi:MAG: trypsin-like peptidase domain-containing protein [Verrucomicrobia bacterium]|nr:trypsin-like peptidase domain-containing protein [Verrucomicrobiota bacterium]